MSIMVRCGGKRERTVYLYCTVQVSDRVKVTVKDIVLSA